MGRMAKDEDEDGVNRLHNIVVQEVSLVDRAANKRRFLVTKRSEDMGKKLVPDGKGGYIEKSEKDDEEKAKASGKGDEDEAKKKAAAKPKKEEGDEGEEKAEKAKASDEGDEGDEGDEEKAKKKGKPDEKAEKENVRKQRVDLLVKTAEACAKVAESVNDGGDLPDSFVEDMTANITKIAGGMAASSKVLSALDDLSKTLAKIKGGASKEEDEEEEDEEEEKAKSKTEKALVAKMQKMEQTLEKQNAEIRRLREEPGSSNSNVEKSSGGMAKDDVFWPLDLAGEDKVSKSSAEKRGVSFYDPAE